MSEWWNNEDANKHTLRRIFLTVGVLALVVGLLFAFVTLSPSDTSPDVRYVVIIIVGGALGWVGGQGIFLVWIWGR